MAYAPGVTNISGQLLAQGMAQLGLGIGNALETRAAKAKEDYAEAKQRRDEEDFLRATFDGVSRQRAQAGLPMLDPAVAQKFEGGSVATKRGIVSQETMALQQFLQRQAAQPKDDAANAETQWRLQQMGSARRGDENEQVFNQALQQKLGEDSVDPGLLAMSRFLKDPNAPLGGMPDLNAFAPPAGDGSQGAGPIDPGAMVRFAPNGANGTQLDSNALLKLAAASGVALTPGFDRLLERGIQRGNLTLNFQTDPKSGKRFAIYGNSIIPSGIDSDIAASPISLGDMEPGDYMLSDGRHIRVAEPKQQSRYQNAQTEKVYQQIIDEIGTSLKLDQSNRDKLAKNKKTSPQALQLLDDQIQAKRDSIRAYRQRIKDGAVANATSSGAGAGQLTPEQAAVMRKYKAGELSNGEAARQLRLLGVRD